MELRHTVRWKDKYNNIKNGTDHRSWTRLKNKFDGRSLTRFDLLLDALNTPNYNTARVSINKVLRNDLLTLPKGEFFSIQNQYPDLPTFLGQLQKVCTTHTAYALICARLACEFLRLSLSNFAKLTIIEYNGVRETLPEWLRYVLDRQRQIAINSGLEDSDPLFFVMRWSDFHKTSLTMRHIKLDDTEVTDTLYKFKMRYNYSIGEYVKSYVVFSGMPPGAIIQHVIPGYTGTQFNSDHSLYGKVVSIYEYSDVRRKRAIRAFGYILWGEKGIYLVHTDEGAVWCPYYLLGTPTVRPNREKDHNLKMSLANLGYESPEFYRNISDHRTLRGHRIQRKPIKDNHVIQNESNLDNNDASRSDFRNSVNESNDPR